MVVCIKDKNFSGACIKQEPNNIIIHLKPFEKGKCVQIKDGRYNYLDIKQVVTMI